jgi:predicted DsbA family dithiol-disulfide isomerase
MSVDVIHFTDPACPWAYSAEPDLNALRYRYGTGLRWRRVMIGLAETHEQYDARGYKPESSAASRTTFARRFGMPFRFEARARNLGTGLPCRAVKAAELQDDDLAEALLRALRFGYFTTPLLMDTEDAIRTQAETVSGLDVDRLLTDLKSDAVEQAYQADRAETRNADVTGRPMLLQDKHANSDGANRYTAPSVLFERDGRRLVAGGWQSFAVYDAMVANLAPELERRETPEPGELLPYFPHGLTTQEVAVACTGNLRETDREGTLRTLVGLGFEGKARRVDVGDDALWFPV